MNFGASERPPDDVASLSCLEMSPKVAEAGLRLSRIAGWNQTLEDWSFLLESGSGIGFRTPQGLWIASMVTLPMGAHHGWISMVLTDPDWRRHGLAKRLMEIGMDSLQKAGLTATLDATPEGEKIYRTIGFTGGWALARWRVEPLVGTTFPMDPCIQSIAEGELDEVADWDREFSGCDRRDILAHLLSSKPELALVKRMDDGRISGYIMGRTGSRLPQLGPLVAAEPETASRLFEAAMSLTNGPFYVDAFDCHQSHLAKSSGVVWTKERPFTRMVSGKGTSPGKANNLFLAVGPELG